MNRLTRNLFILLITCSIILFLIILIISPFVFSGSEYLKSYRTVWIFSNTIITFFDLFLPLTAAVILLSYSYFYTGSKYTGSGSLASLISPGLILFIIFALIFTVFQEGFIPGMQQKQAHQKFNTVLAREFKEKYIDLIKNEEFSEAKDYLHLYLTIDPKNDNALDSLNKVNRKLRTIQIEESDTQEIEEVIDYAEVNTLLRQLQLAQKNADYFYTIYIANLILEHDQENLNAKRAIAIAVEGLNSVSLSQEEKEIRNYYNDKIDAYTALYEEGNIPKAYYLLKDLNNKNPDDLDVQRYFKTAKQRLQNVSFFIEDAEKGTLNSGHTEIVFRNEFSENYAQIIRIGKINLINDMIFCKDIEVLSVSYSTGSVLYHVTYPYGNLSYKDLLIRSFSKTNSNMAVLPIIHEKADNIEIPNIKIDLALSVYNLLDLSSENSDLSIMGISKLWNIKSLYSKAGFSVDSININIISRLQKPFSFLHICFISLLIGIMFHLNDNKKKKFIYILFIPVPFFMSLIISEVIIYSALLINGLIFVLLGFSLTLVLMVVINLIIFIIILILLAGQKIHAA